MQAINRESKTSVFFNVGFLLASAFSDDRTRTVDFQKALLESGLDFAQTASRANSFILTRTDPSNLQVKLESPGPQVSAVNITAQNPQYDLDAFVHDADAVTDAYQKTFPAQQYQLIQRSARINHLYSCQAHAFKYLWEDRLGQSPDDFKTLGRRPVAGGGLRFILPAHAQAEGEPYSIEIRAGSALREPGKLVIETIFVWPRPHVVAADDKFNLGDLLQTVEQYAADEVFDFLTQQKSSD